MKPSATRTEHDSMGKVEIPEKALYGPQTQRAVNNFIISDQTMPWDFIAAILQIKEAAAEANSRLGLLTKEQGAGIKKCCQELLQERNSANFPVSVYQTGSGTSTNMNVNEVISHLAATKGVEIHANDHVNLGQSSNDVIPSAILVSSAIAVQSILLPSLHALITEINDSAARYSEVVKTGRTHLMDALPLRLRHEFQAWAVQLEECGERLQECFSRLCRLPLGGTAIGSGVNCHPEFAGLAVKLLSDSTGISFGHAKSLYKGLSSMDSPLELSSHLKTLAMCLFKIANDLRWMNSGPLAGLGDIKLPALQPGSSIMPAKVNPVIPEAVCMASLQVFGYDTAITMAAGSGNFQLNTMLPLIGTNLLNSISLLNGCCISLREKVFPDLEINSERYREALEKNPILVTALNPEIGYMKAAEIGKIAASENRTVFEVALERTDLGEERLKELLNPAKLADGGSN